MQLKDKIKIIEKYICDNFEDWDLEDPIAEGYLDDYQEITGTSETDIKAFEEKFKISIPYDVKDLYSYKNGSTFFTILPCLIG
jgi:SMI1 / KNR4 family protein